MQFRSWLPEFMVMISYRPAVSRATRCGKRVRWRCNLWPSPPWTIFKAGRRDKAITECYITSQVLCADSNKWKQRLPKGNLCWCKACGIEKRRHFRPGTTSIKAERRKILWYFEWMNEWVNKWMNECINAWMNGNLATGIIALNLSATYTCWNRKNSFLQ